MSFWKSVRKYWTGVLTVPDDDTKKEETKKDKCQEDPQGMIHMDTNFKYDNQRMYIVINEKFEDSRIYDYLWFNKEGRG